MNKQCLAILVSLLLFCPLFSLSGQEVASDDSLRLFDISLGFVGGFRLDDSVPVGGHRFSFDFSVADNVRAGIALTTSGDAAVQDQYASFLLRYRLGKVSVLMDVGRLSAAPADVAAGIGFSFPLFESISREVIHSALNLQVQYLFSTSSGVDKGSVLIGCIGSFGV